MGNSRKKIINCDFKYKCNRTWSSLLETADASVRHCTVCDKGVHLCFNMAEVRHAARNGWCIALTLDDPENALIGDVKYPIGFDGAE